MTLEHMHIVHADCVDLFASWLGQPIELEQE
jgi:hypothetical protein